MGEIKGKDAQKAILVVAIMTLHAVGEGSGVGVSFSSTDGYQASSIDPPLPPTSLLRRQNVA